MSEEPATERWLFVGLRVSDGNKRVHEWRGPDSQPMWFAAKGIFGLGYYYDVKVTRWGDGRITKHGTPSYTGEKADESLRLKLAVEGRAVEQVLQVARVEKKAAADNELDTLIAKLSQILNNYSHSQRSAVVGYILRKLMRGW